MSILFSSSVWHLAGLLLVQVDRLELVVAAYVAFSVTASIQTMLYRWWSFFSIKEC